MFASHSFSILYFSSSIVSSRQPRARVSHVVTSLWKTSGFNRPDSRARPPAISSSISLPSFHGRALPSPPSFSLHFSLHLHLRHCFPEVARDTVRSTHARYEPRVEITKVPGVDAQVSPLLIWSPRFRHRASSRSAVEKTAPRTQQPSARG